MSHPPPPSFQAHELVYCAQCYLSYDTQVNITRQPLPQDAAHRTWYLTNCGHALCSHCLFPDAHPPPHPPDDTVPCPKCGDAATVVPLGAELPPEILPYFRSIAESSEEVLAAIKFQHQNLLHLVDHLQSRVTQLTSLVHSAQQELEKTRDQKIELEELRKQVVELKKRLVDREIMPPPLPSGAPSATPQASRPPATAIRRPFLKPGLPLTPVSTPRLFPPPHASPYHRVSTAARDLPIPIAYKSPHPRRPLASSSAIVRATASSAGPAPATYISPVRARFPQREIAGSFVEGLRSHGSRNSSWKS